VSSGFDPAGAVSLAEASASDVKLFGNLIQIESVVTRTSARSDGVKGTVAGGTTVQGAMVGPYAVTIDSTGVHIADQGIATAPAQKAVNELLRDAGVSMEVAPPVDTITGPKASRSLAGVIVRMKSSTVEPLISFLPTEIQKQIRDRFTFDQDITVQLAPAVVTAGAAKVIEFEPPALPPVVGGSEETSTPGSVEVPASDSGGSTTTTGSPPSVTGGAPVAIAPARTTYEGVPVWLVVLLVLAAFASSRPLTMAADRIFAARASTTCPDETS
jgi:hypothetical protein